MRKFLLVVALVAIALVGCNLQKEWVIQDRDNYGALDAAGLDRWIENDPTLKPSKKKALLLMNGARRGRIKRGCDTVGVTTTASIEEE